MAILEGMKFTLPFGIAIAVAVMFLGLPALAGGPFLWLFIILGVFAIVLFKA